MPPPTLRADRQHDKTTYHAANRREFHGRNLDQPSSHGEQSGGLTRRSDTLPQRDGRDPPSRASPIDGRANLGAWKLRLSDRDEGSFRCAGSKEDCPVPVVIVLPSDLNEKM